MLILKGSCQPITQQLLFPLGFARLIHESWNIWLWIHDSWESTTVLDDPAAWCCLVNAFPVLGWTSQMHPATLQSINKPKTLHWEILVLTWLVSRTILMICTQLWGKHWWWTENSKTKTESGFFLLLLFRYLLLLVMVSCCIWQRTNNKCWAVYISDL